MNVIDGPVDPMAAIAVVAGFFAPYLFINNVLAPKMGLVEDPEKEERKGPGVWKNGKYILDPITNDSSKPYDITKQVPPQYSVLNEAPPSQDYDQPVEKGDGATEFFFPPPR